MFICTERELAWCQLCRDWWHRCHQSRQSWHHGDPAYNHWICHTSAVAVAAIMASYHSYQATITHNLRYRHTVPVMAVLVACFVEKRPREINLSFCIVVTMIVFIILFEGLSRLFLKWSKNGHLFRFHYSDVAWRLKSPETQSFVQQHADTINNENMKAPHYWPFVRQIHRSHVNSPHKGAEM